MKIIKALFLILILLIPFANVSAGSLDSMDDFNNIFDTGNPNKIHYCDTEGECWLQEWIDTVKWEISDIEDEKKLSEYVQDVIKYLLTFMTLIAVIYIIYAWFNLLIAGGENEEKSKKTKSIIIYVTIWLAIIWLAYPIVGFIIDILSSWATTTNP